MLDQENEAPGFSVGLCILQLCGAPLATLVFGVLIGEVFEKLLGITGDDRKAGLSLGYLLFAVVGFLIGYVTQTAIPRVYHSGGPWIWTAPGAILLWGVVDQLSRNPGKVIDDFLIPPPGDEGLGLVLFTWPMLATCLYSVGIVIANRSGRTRREKSI